MSKDVVNNQNHALKRAHAACQQPVWIDNEQALLTGIAQWKQSGLLGIDTEFIRETTYYPHLALIQISDGQCVWLIDSVKLSSHQALAETLDDPALTKILHSPREDLEVLRQVTAALPRPLFDTQAAAALCGHSLQSSYSALLDTTLDVQLDKEMARSDWLQRPLSEAQIGYACRDVAYLPLTAQALEQQLHALQRWDWFVEDMQWLLQDSTQTISKGELYLAVPGAARLTPTAVKLLQALCEWREETAQQRNLPRQFVLRNDALLKVAQQPPAHPDELFQYDAIRPSQARRYGAEVCAVITAARQRQAPPPVPQLSPAQQQCIKKAQKKVRATAQDLALEPAVLASRRELERWLKDGVDNPPARLRGWRWQVIGNELAQILGAGT